MDKKISLFENYLLYFLSRYLNEKRSGKEHTNFEKGEFHILLKVYEYLFLDYEKN